MPLVVPGLQSKDGTSSSSTDDWMSKLMGKKLGDQHDEMVSLYTLYSPSFLPSSLSSPFSFPSLPLPLIALLCLYFATYLLIIFLPLQ